MPLLLDLVYSPKPADLPVKLNPKASSDFPRVSGKSLRTQTPCNPIIIAKKAKIVTGLNVLSTSGMSRVMSAANTQ